jgi:hypothetical protein
VVTIGAVAFGVMAVTGLGILVTLTGAVLAGDGRRWVAAIPAVGVVMVAFMLPVGRFAGLEGVRWLAIGLALGALGLAGRDFFRRRTLEEWLHESRVQR